MDSDQDPYTIGKGFWYAHWTWVMEAKDHPLVGVADLEKDPLVRWQHRHHFLIGAVVATIPLWIGLGTGNPDDCDDTLSTTRPGAAPIGLLPAWRRR